MLMVMFLMTILINIQTTSYASTSIQGMNISFAEGGLEIPEVDVTNITAISIGAEVEFRIYYSGTNITHYNMFNPPSGTIVQKMKEFTQEDMNNGYMSIRIPLDTVEKCKSLTLFVQHRKDYTSTNVYFIPENETIDYQKLPVSVEFSDEFLSETIKDDLGITGSVFTSDLLKIEKLDLSNKGIKNLNGIEYLKNVKILDITNNKITDISKINNLEKLEKLYIHGNPIQDYLLDSNIISQLIDYDFELDYQRAIYANQLKEIGVFKGTSNGFELYREPTMTVGTYINCHILSYS